MAAWGQVQWWGLRFISGSLGEAPCSRWPSPPHLEMQTPDQMSRASSQPCPLPCNQPQGVQGCGGCRWPEEVGRYCGDSLGLHLPWGNSATAFTLLTRVGLNCLLPTPTMNPAPGRAPKPKEVSLLLLSHSVLSNSCATLWTVPCQAPLSMEFSRQGHWNGFPCPPLGDIPNPGVEPGSLVSSVSQADSLPLSHWGAP